MTNGIWQVVSVTIVYFFILVNGQKFGVCLANISSKIVDRISYLQRFNKVNTNAINPRNNLDEFNGFNHYNP
jgi:hypothetical protein